jgi:hypothetical protein
VTDDERLSRWLSGDLPPVEAAAFDARLQEEPELDQRLQALSGWIDDLSHLDDLPVPAALDAAVLGAAGPAVVIPSRRAIPWGPLVGLAAAAVALFVLSPVPLQVTLQGDQLQLTGDGALMIDDVQVDIDGITIVALEATGPQISVEQGTATLTTPGDLPKVLSSGQHVLITGQQLLSSGSQHQLTRNLSLQVAATQASTDSIGEISRLRARITELETALATSQTVGSFVQGQLVATRGEAVPWPEMVEPGMEPDLFHAAVLDTMDGVQDIEVQDVDCSEYPCLALLRVHAPEELVTDLVNPLIDAIAAEIPGTSVSVFSHRFRGPAGGVSLVGFAVAPGQDLHRDGDVGVRLGFRADTLATDHARDLVMH